MRVEYTETSPSEPDPPADHVADCAAAAGYDRDTAPHPEHEVPRVDARTTVG